MDPPRSVTVAVIGDAGVGKTCLITAAAAEAFADHPPPVLPPTRLPADATPEGVPLLLVDTSAREEDRPAREAALQAADVVVVAFDACAFCCGGGGRKGGCARPGEEGDGLALLPLRPCAWAGGWD